MVHIIFPELFNVQGCLNYFLAIGKAKFPLNFNEGYRFFFDEQCYSKIGFKFNFSMFALNSRRVFLSTHLISSFSYIASRLNHPYFSISSIYYEIYNIFSLKCFLYKLSLKGNREFVQRLDLSGNESFHRHISGSSVTPHHCADWTPHPQHSLTTTQHFKYILSSFYENGLSQYSTAPFRNKKIGKENKEQIKILVTTRPLQLLLSGVTRAETGDRGAEGGENITKMRALKS